MKRIVGVIVAVVVVSALAMAADPPASPAVDDPSAVVLAPARCSVAGVWLEYQPGLGSNFLILTPLDRHGIRFALDIESIDMDATLWGMFPGAEFSHFRGVAERVDPGRFAFSGIAYAVGDQLDPDTGTLEIAYMMTMAGEFAVSDDCSALYPTGEAGIYAPWQDPFGSEAPLYGCMPTGGTGSVVRLPDWTPCQLPP